MEVLCKNYKKGVKDNIRLSCFNKMNLNKKVLNQYIDFNKIDWKEFEDMCTLWAEYTFHEENTKIKHTSFIKDQGKDIEIIHESRIGIYKAWIECKNHKRNLGIQEIGKNVVLIISKKINKVIFMSTSRISTPAKIEILSVSESFGFDVSFFDSDDLKMEFLKTPPIVKKYFPSCEGISAKLLEKEILFNVSLSEIRNGNEDNSIDLWPLQKKNTLTINVIIKNLMNQRIENIDVKVIEYQNNFQVKINHKTISILESSSDKNVSFFCELINFNQSEVTLPIVCIDANGKVYSQELGCLNITQLYKFPYVGDEKLYFKRHDFNRHLQALNNNRSSIIYLYGKSGTGKSRYIEELQKDIHHSNIRLCTINCTTKKSFRVLQELISGLMNIPFLTGNISASKENIKELISSINGSEEYANAIYELLIESKINKNDIYLIENAIYYFLQKSKMNKSLVIIIDNIQELNQIVMEMLINIFNKIINISCKIMFIISMNTEVYPNFDFTQDEIISYFEDLKNNHSSRIDLLHIKQFNEKEARIFLMNALSLENEQDQFITQFIKKSGYLPFDIIMALKYLNQNNVIYKSNSKISYITNFSNYQKFIDEIPSSSKRLIDKRIKNIKQNKDKVFYDQCLLSFKLITCFFNHAPIDIFDHFQIEDDVIKYLIDLSFITCNEINFYSFYHDNLYRFFIQSNYFTNKKKIYKEIMNWCNKKEVTNDKCIDEQTYLILRFYYLYYFYNRDIEKYFNESLEIIKKLQTCFEHRYAIEIAQCLRKEIKGNTEKYFIVSMLLASSLWETIDAMQTIGIYKEIYTFKSLVSVEQQCQFFHKYINSLFHIGLHKEALDILHDFKNLKNKSDFYEFILYNRFSVAYCKLNNQKKFNYYIDKSLKVCERLEGTFWQSTAYSEKAFNAMYNKKDRDETIDYFNLAIDNYKEIEDNTYYRNLEISYQKSLVVFFNGQIDDALKIINQGIDNCKKICNIYMEIKLSNMKSIYNLHNNNDKEALDIWKKLLRKSEILKSISWQYHIIYNIAETYFLIKEYEIASQYYFESLKILINHIDYNITDINDVNINLINHLLYSCDKTDNVSLKDLIIAFLQQDEKLKMLNSKNRIAKKNLLSLNDAIFFY